MDAIVIRRAVGTATCACIAVILFGCASTHKPPPPPGPRVACTAQRPAKSHVLAIVMVNGAPNRVDKASGKSDALHACPGDAVTWRLVGYEFEIQFKGQAEENPFGWGKGARKSSSTSGGRPAELRAAIPTDAQRGRTYEYSVTVNGKLLDPQIIIDN